MSHSDDQLPISFQPSEHRTTAALSVFSITAWSIEMLGAKANVSASSRMKSASRDALLKEARHVRINSGAKLPSAASITSARKASIPLFQRKFPDFTYSAALA